MNASRRKLIIINDDDSLFSIRLSFLPAPFVRPMKSACSVLAESPAMIGERRRLIHEHVIKLLKCFLTKKDFLINCGAAGGSASCSFAVFFTVSAATVTPVALWFVSRCVVDILITPTFQVVDGVQVGIVSTGATTCGINFPGVYTNVTHPSIRAFIMQRTGI